MFTGFIEEIGRVASVSSNKLVVAANKVLKGMEPGDSISVNGSCLTVTNLNSNSFYVDIMAETLKRTNLGLLHTEDSVNLERALTLGKLLGGHLVQGHVDATGRVISVRREEGTTMMMIDDRLIQSCSCKAFDANVIISMSNQHVMTRRQSPAESLYNRSARLTSSHQVGSVSGSH